MTCCTDKEYRCGKTAIRNKQGTRQCFLRTKAAKDNALAAAGGRPVAQLAERRSPKPQVGGSIPSWPAILTQQHCETFSTGRLMNANTETSPGGILDTVKLALAVALLIGGIAGFYEYEEQSLLVSVSVILVAVALAIVAFMQTWRGRELWHFIQGSRGEIRKVIWPTRTEAVQTTLTVFVFVLILGIFFWGLDMVLVWVTKSLTGQGS